MDFILDKTGLLFHFVDSDFHALYSNHIIRISLILLFILAIQLTLSNSGEICLLFLEFNRNFKFADFLLELFFFPGYL